jgi:hypothetical protein
MSGTCLVSVTSKGVAVMRKIDWNVWNGFVHLMTVYLTQIFLDLTPCLGMSTFSRVKG